MFILSRPESTLARPERLFAGLRHHDLHRSISSFLIVCFTLTMTGIPALVSGAGGDPTLRVRDAQGSQDRTYAPQVTLSEFGKCYATTDPVVREVARGAGVVQVGEALPDGKLRVSIWTVPGRVPEALADVRQLLQNSRPFLQAFCTVCLPECPATAILSDRATFAASHALRAPGADVLAQPYGPFLGAGAGPAAATVRETASAGAAVTSRRLEPSERLTADAPRLAPQSGVPPGPRTQALRSSLLSSLAPCETWRTFPPAPQEHSTTPEVAGVSAEALAPAVPAVSTDRSSIINPSQRAG